MLDSNRRPDEEGIKTPTRRGISPEAQIPTADLMKKGLRLSIPYTRHVFMHSNRRPDEEGIKTGRDQPVLGPCPIPTADLMKKGLRLLQLPPLVEVPSIPTADLMKKGLRHQRDEDGLELDAFQPQT